MRLLLACLIFLHLAACANDQPTIELLVDVDVAHAVAIDLVVVEDEQLFRQLLVTQAPDWFENKPAYQVMGSVTVRSYQLPPMASVTDAAFPPSRATGVKRLVIVLGSDGPVVIETSDQLTRVVIHEDTVSVQESGPGF